MMLWQHGWVWVVAGVVLAALEMVVPGFYLLGLAIGAVVVGLLVWGGVLSSATLPVMLLVGAIIAAISWWLLRRFVGVRKGQIRYWTRDINED